MPTIRRFCASVLVLSATLLQLNPLIADDEGARLLVRRLVDDALVYVVQYAEQWAENPPVGSGWRSILCVEVLKKGAPKLTYPWQQCTLGRHGFSDVHSFILSDAWKGHFVMAYCRSNANDTSVNVVKICLISLDGDVDPLPAEMIDPKTRVENWKNSPTFVVPDRIEGFPRPYAPQVSAFWKDKLGIELTLKQTISLVSAVKADTGWRIDAAVMDLTPISAKQRDGSSVSVENPFPILRFAILLDEECKSAKIEVLK